MPDTNTRPTCDGAGRVDLIGYADRVAIAYLQERIHPDVFIKLAARLRELEESKGGTKMVLTFNVRGREIVEVVPDWAERYTQVLRPLDRRAR